MEQPTGQLAALTHSVDEDGHHFWALANSAEQDEDWEPEPVVEAYQYLPGCCEVFTLPDSRTDMGHVGAPCDLADLVVQLVGEDVVISAAGAELARVPTALCPLESGGCGRRVADWHVTGRCRRCEAELEECGQRNCRICYPLSWAQADEPMRYWRVVFELTYGDGTARTGVIEAHNEQEATDEALHEVFDDYDPADGMEEDHFWSKNVRNCDVIETVAPRA